MTFSVKLTRNEYMDFCAKTRRKSVWSAVLGMFMLVGANGVYLLEGYMLPIAWLLVAVGLFLLSAETVWLSLREKGEAGRRYDASDTLSGAVTVTIDESTVTVKTASMEGTVPLAWMTAKKKTVDMVCLCFGEELFVYIPRRAVSAEEWERVCHL